MLAQTCHQICFCDAVLNSCDGLLSLYIFAMSVSQVMGWQGWVFCTSQELGMGRIWRMHWVGHYCYWSLLWECIFMYVFCTSII